MRRSPRGRRERRARRRGLRPRRAGRRARARRRARSPAGPPSPRSGYRGSRRRPSHRGKGVARGAPQPAAAPVRRAAGGCRRRPTRAGRRRPRGEGGRRSRQKVEQRQVAFVAEQARRVARREPADLVDLVVLLEAVARNRAHRPPANLLRPPATIRVLGRADICVELAADARLLVYLTQCAILVGLAVVALPLRERPVVVARAVYEQDLTAADDEAARSPDHRHAARSSFRHAPRQARRASSRRCRSPVMRAPAASASGAAAFAASARSRSSATTASWCSPGTSWSDFACRTIFLWPASSWA